MYFVSMPPKKYYTRIPGIVSLAKEADQSTLTQGSSCVTTNALVP